MATTMKGREMMPKNKRNLKNKKIKKLCAIYLLQSFSLKAQKHQRYLNQQSLKKKKKTTNIIKRDKREITFSTKAFESFF